MRKFVAFLLLFSCAVSLMSCAKETQPEYPVNFYYRRWEIAYNDDSDVITYELREGKSHALDVAYMLKEYLKGPISKELYSAIPENTRLIKLSLTESSAQVLLSDGFARLSGLDLSICGACITFTVIDLTGVKTVQISTQNVPLNNQPHITMNKDCLKFMDEAVLVNPME